MKLWRTTGILVLVGMLAGMLALAGCSSKQTPTTQPPAKEAAKAPDQAKDKAAAPASEKPKELKKINIAYTSPSFTFLPAFVALEKGLYQKYGMEVTPVMIKSSVAAAALVSGEVDYGMSITTPIASAQQGSPIKLLLVSSKVPDFALVTRPEIKEAKDIKGKVLGSTGLRGANYNSLKYMLKHLGIDANKDVSVIDSGTEATNYEIIKSGQIVGAALGYPWPVIAKKDGLNVLVNTSDVLKEFPLGGVVAADKTIKEKPNDVKAILNAQLDALKYVQENRAGTVEVIQKVFKLDKALAEESYDGMLKLENFTKDGLISDDGIKFTMEINAEAAAGDVKVVPVSQVADFTLLKEVLKERAK